MKKVAKTKVLRARVDAKTAELVDFCCNKYGITASAFIRDAVEGHLAVQFGKAKLMEVRQ